MKLIISESQHLNFLRRRFSTEDLEYLIKNVYHMIEDEGIIPEMAIYDCVRELIKSKKFSDIDEFGDELSYWYSYLVYEKPLVSFVVSQLGLK